MSIFCEEEGVLSCRRVLAFIFGLAGIITGTISVILNASWQTSLIAFGVPMLACILLLLFTTWTEVAHFASAIKGVGK